MFTCREMGKHPSGTLWLETGLVEVSEVATAGDGLVMIKMFRCRLCGLRIVEGGGFPED